MTTYLFNGKQTDLHFLIWDHTWETKVPQSSLITRSEIKEIGVPSTGDEMMDRDLMNQYVTHYMSINKMLEFFVNGVPMKLSYSKDAKTIYEIVQTYLDYWQNVLETSLNQGVVPYDDLIDLNEFANTLFTYARVDYAQTAAPMGSLMRTARSLGLTNFSNLFSRYTEPQKSEAFKRKDMALELKKRRSGAIKWT